MLHFSKLSKHYGLQTVLDGIDFSIAPKEFVTIMGPSGAGKSTLIALLIGAEKPNSGGIHVEGVNIENLSAAELQMYRRRVGVVFQDFKLLEKRTVFENAAFALEVCGEENVVIEHKVGEALQKVGLSAMAHKFPHQLSGGEQQRVAIARALIHSPKLLIADEPTGNLDPKNTKEIASLLRKINTEEGVTVIVTTHNPVFLEEISPCRLLRLENGNITTLQSEENHALKTEPNPSAA